MADRNVGCFYIKNERSDAYEGVRLKSQTNDIIVCAKKLKIDSPERRTERGIYYETVQ